MNRDEFAKQWMFYRIMAVVVGSVLLVLTGFLISVRGLQNPEPAFYAAAWTAHGYLFPIYVVATFMLSTKLKWSFGKTILIMLAGTVPFMSFLTERKVAREVASEFRGELDAMRAENEKLREQLTSTGTQVSEASFEQRLYRMVPDFEAVNANPKWIAWLNEVDPLIRAPRSSVAQQAFNRGDAEGVAHYVAMFKQTIAPVEQKADKTEELERQLQPNRGATSAPPTSQKGKVYTNADIEKMFRKAADLGTKGQTDAAKKLEAEIDAAYMEGRVVA